MAVDSMFGYRRPRIKKRVINASLSAWSLAFDAQWAAPPSVVMMIGAPFGTLLVPPARGADRVGSASPADTAASSSDIAKLLRKAEAA